MFRRFSKAPRYRPKWRPFPTLGPRAALVVALAAGLTPGAEAQTVSGIGARECGAFSRALQIESEAAVDAYLAWAQGYLSGVNASARGELDIRIDHAGLLHWLATWCGGHPDAYFYEAVAAVVDAHR